MNKRKSRIIIAAVIAVVVAVLGTAVLYCSSQVKTQLENARTLKSDLRSLGESLSHMDIDNAKDALVQSDNDRIAMQQAMQNSFWQFAPHIPRIGKQVDTANSLLQILEETSDTILHPAISFLETTKQDDPEISKNDLLISAMSLGKNIYPQAQQIVSRLNSMDLSFFDRNGQISTLVGEADRFITTLDFDVAFMDRISQTLSDYPIDSLTTEDGFYVPAIRAYLSLAESMLPVAEHFCDSPDNDAMIRSLESERLTGYLETMQSLLDLYRENPEIIALIHKVLDVDRDQCFMLTALNSSEIRACGGFPGANGIISIESGYLKIGDFSNAYNTLPRYTPAKAHISENEQALYLGSMNLPWDASFCPDFERDASIWAMAYEARHHRCVDGVIGMTPVVIQKLLSVVGDVTLSDGTVLTGENATHMIQYDIYFRNFQKGKGWFNGDQNADLFFAETAKTVLKRVLSEKHAHYLPMYLDIVKDGFANRTMMMWMADPETQEIVRGLHWDGSLNDNPEAPEAGIFVNCVVASKMGWFLEMDTHMGDPVEIGNGQLSYPMTVTLTNSITADEIQRVNTYVLGPFGGSFMGSMYLFAPYGGTVKNFQSSPGVNILRRNYRNLDLGHVTYFGIRPGKTLTVTYDLICAPGVTQKPVIVKTPTLQEYHTPVS